MSQSHFIGASEMISLRITCDKCFASPLSVTYDAFMAGADVHLQYFRIHIAIRNGCCCSGQKMYCSWLQTSFNTTSFRFIVEQVSQLGSHTYTPIQGNHE